MRDMISSAEPKYTRVPGEIAESVARSCIPRLVLLAFWDHHAGVAGQGLVRQRGAGQRGGNSGNGGAARVGVAQGVLTRWARRAFRAVALGACLGVLAGCTSTEVVPISEPDTFPEVNPYGEQHAGGIRDSEGRMLLDKREITAVQNLMQNAQDLRHLRFTRGVGVMIESDRAMTAFMRSRVEQDVAEDMYRRYLAFGLIPREQTLESLLDEAMKSIDIAGYYDERKKVLVVRDDAVIGLRSLNPSARIHRGIVVHELVHTLQDQHFNLQAHLAPGKLQGDELAAFMALAEGDATLVELSYLLSSLGGIEFESVLRDPQTLETMLFGTQGKSLGAHSLSVPAFQDSVSFRYLSGALFVAALYRKGGWQAVNDAYRNPPRTTAEIYDPARYLQQWHATGAKLPSLTALKSDGYRVTQTATVGRRELNAFLAPIAVNADGLAAEWDGDEIAVFVKRRTYGFLLSLRLAEAESAERVAEVIADLSAETSERVYVHRDGRRLLIGRQLDRDTFDRVRAGF